MSDRFRNKWVLFSFLSVSLLICLALNSVCPAVTSKIMRQSTSADLLKGEIENLVIGSRGTIQLGRSAEVLVDEFENVWSINSIVASGGAIYAGTSPNGGIYKYSLNKLTKIYPLESADEPKNATEPNDPNAADAELSNEHIFAMATDLAGRVLAGISGAQCKLIRFEADKMELVFEPDDAKYIFAVDIDAGGNILAPDRKARFTAAMHSARSRKLFMTVSTRTYSRLQPARTASSMPAATGGDSSTR